MKIPINVITSNKDTFNIFLWPYNGINTKKEFTEKKCLG